MNEKCLIWMALLVGIDGAWAHEGRMVDLKEAPLDQQVEAVEYCHGQYKVKLKDEARQVFMEFDLRFRTDSGPNGPRPGSPVLIPDGMRGDRAFLVFSRPDEMKVFLKETC
jgi:cytochrome c